MFSLNGKVAIVTGAAMGVGKAIALKMAEAGADVIVTDKDEEKGKETAAMIKAMGRDAFFEPCDLWNFESVQQMCDRAIKHKGKVDIMVACGASGSASNEKFFLELDVAQYPVCLLSQQFSRLYCIKAIAPHMKEREYGKIIIITTDAGRFPTPREMIIGSAAAGLIQAVKVIAKEFTRFKVRVNTICISVVENTPAYNRTMAGEARHIFAKATEKMPLGIPSADDIAGAVVFMACPESDKITGQTLSVNSGLSFVG